MFDFKPNDAMSAMLMEELAMAAYEAACKRWPGKIVTLRQGGRIIKATRVYNNA